MLGLSGFYEVTTDMPPRLMIFVSFTFLLIIVLFIRSSGKQYIDSLDISKLSLLHIVRIPVEFVLYLLYVHHAVPELMTFAGRNFDILSGISAPFIFYYGFKKKILKLKLILIWNFICLGLLINIVMHAVLSAPFPFQQLAFDQPNIAILYFPFIWLPTCVVPIVLFSHLASIRQLLTSNYAKK